MPYLSLLKQNLLQAQERMRRVGCCCVVCGPLLWDAWAASGIVS